MSNTINVPVSSTWTEVSAVAGFASATSSCEFCESDSTPAEALRGHRVSTDGLTFNPGAGQKLYFRGTTGTAVAVFTGAE